jgi:hypothetical protein
MVLSFIWFGLGAHPATYRHVGDALSWDGNKICDCHHALGDSVFNAQAMTVVSPLLSHSLLIDGDC